MHGRQGVRVVDGGVCAAYSSFFPIAVAIWKGVCEAEDGFCRV